MRRDEAIEQIRAVRHKISAEHGHDTRRLVRRYQEMEKRYADRILRESVLVVPDTDADGLGKS